MILSRQMSSVRHLARMGKSGLYRVLWIWAREILKRNANVGTRSEGSRIILECILLQNWRFMD
jgi:hypothetical protein